ncbi:MAG: hypothetical protein ABI451_10735 [Dokdonella sp.]
MLDDGSPALSRLSIRQYEGGQSAFAAIIEAVAMFQGEAETEWSKVSIVALRNHLVDLDNITVHAAVSIVPLTNGLRFAMTGDGAVRGSIRRMAAISLAGEAAQTIVPAPVHMTE